MSGLLLDATAKGTIVTYSCPLLGINTVLSGTGVSDWITVDDVETALMEVGTDGTLIVSVKPNMIKGTLTLLPSSPSLQVIANIMAKQYSTNLVIQGTLTLSSISGLWVNKYDQFVWTSAFKGYELGDKVKDIPLKFACAIPQTFNLANVTAVASAISSLL